MPVTLITPAADAPVTLEDVKAWCRIDFTDQDELVESLIAAATEEVQRLTGRQFVPATFLLTLRCFPDCLIRLPRSPLISVETVKYRDTDGDLVTLTNESTIWSMRAPNPQPSNLSCDGRHLRCTCIAWNRWRNSERANIVMLAGFEAVKTQSGMAPIGPTGVR